MQKTFDISFKTSYSFIMVKPLFRKIARIVMIIIGAGMAVLQFIPSSFDRTNPPVTGEPAWDAPDTRATFMTACGDCHSNETRYPWYSRIAPGSWLIESDIREGRKHFNISEWDRSQRGADDAAEEVRRGAMPVGPYLLMHPEANLSAAEKKRFVEGLHKTFGSEASSTDYNSYETKENE